MKAVVFGGPDDGKELPVTDDQRTYTFTVAANNSTWAKKVSPFAVESDIHVAETWNIAVKRHAATGTAYRVIILPGLAAWLVKNEMGRDTW